MEKNHFVSVAAILTNLSGEVLLIKSPHRGWEFPGGMVEPGEDLQAALIREIFEESGISVKVLGFIGVCKNLQSDIVNLDFRCEYVGGTPTTSDESLEVGWFEPSEALSMITNPLTKKHIENMLSQATCIHFFSFRKNPFEIISEYNL